MKTIIDLYFRFIKLLLVLCMLGMVALVFGNVVLRYVFNSGISVSEDTVALAVCIHGVPWGYHRPQGALAYRHG